MRSSDQLKLATLDKSVLIASSNLTSVNIRSAGELLIQSSQMVGAAYRPFKCDVAFADKVRNLQQLHYGGCIIDSQADLIFTRVKKLLLAIRTLLSKVA